MSDPVDIDRLSAWIGRTEEAQDTVTPGLVERYRATFGRWLHDGGEDAPPGLHWCLSPLAVPPGETGPDGHPARGGFLPPVPLRNRMWAGGSLRMRAPLPVGEPVTCRSRIAAVTAKRGRSGPLVFVSVEHVYGAGGRVFVEERQDIVYRDASPAPRPPEQAPAPPPAPADAFVGDPLTLFRYSAMTFNGHRIHYDHPYATGQEGYAGLVVHGPLQATLLLNAAATRAGTAAIRLDYRGLSPLVAGEPVVLRGEEDRVRLEKPDGTITFAARFTAPDPREAPPA